MKACHLEEVTFEQRPHCKELKGKNSRQREGIQV